MGRRTSLTLGVLALILAGAVAFAMFASSERQPAASAKERGVVPLSAPPPSGTPSEPIKSSNPTLTRRIPASPMIGLDVPALGRSFAVRGVSLGSPIAPPFARSEVADTLYYENNHKVRGADPGTDANNTVYITGHTWRGGTAAMNVIDQRLAVGDELLVTTAESRRLGVRLQYVVADSATYDERRLPDVDKVWQVAPGRMVVLTCNLRADGAHQTHTHVFYAELAGVVS